MSWDNPGKRGLQARTFQMIGSTTVIFRYDENLKTNPAMLPRVQRRQADVERVIGPDHPTAEALWEVRDTYRPRGLVLFVRDGEQQAEEPFESTDLEGNGLFTHRLERMRESLTHNGVWKNAVHRLMDNVLEWSRKLPAVPTRCEVALNEERSGQYVVPSLEIRNGTSTMWVEPVAGWTMNPSGVAEDPNRSGQRALGCVALRGAGGPIYLYYLTPGDEWVYPIQALQSESPSTAYYPLNEAAFIELARACFDA